MSTQKVKQITNDTSSKNHITLEWMDKIENTEHENHSLDHLVTVLIIVFGKVHTKESPQNGKFQTTNSEVRSDLTKNSYSLFKVKIIKNTPIGQKCYDKQLPWEERRNT